jgi:hypothetical protein
LTGRRCKRLLDAGRLHWLRSQHFSGQPQQQQGQPPPQQQQVQQMEGELVEYVEAAISLENALLLAWPQQQPTEQQTQ